MALKGRAGKILYGALFVVVLPALLVAWARATAAVVTIPVPRSLPLGAALAGCGGLLILGGWHALYRHGGGLPMNAFPPPRYVTEGVYRLVRHPIYVGACAVSAGASLATGSASGLWLVTPTLVLACVALVLGYEGLDLEARFGPVDARPLFSPGLFAAVARHSRVWEPLRALAERIANSWSERRLGPVRVINHGAWAALSVLVGLTIAGTLMGPGHGLSLFLAALSGLVGSALWAQLVEGLPALLRPFGWYGGLLGVTIGALAAPLTGTGVWLVLSACCVAGPWIQSLGRLRCLVQGCCHGREAPEGIGIRYTHPRSRVCRLSKLGGVPVHPTQLYSILWNVVIAIVVGRLWSLRVPMSFVAGAYLGLNGFGRFVEEAYRGEPQTKAFAGLRLYQWMALGSVIVGAALTALGASDPAPAPAWSPVYPAIAALFAAITGFAMGVDFPESNRRFSRLV